MRLDVAFEVRAFARYENQVAKADAAVEQRRALPFTLPVHLLRRPGLRRRRPRRRDRNSGRRARFQHASSASFFIGL